MRACALLCLACARADELEPCTCTVEVRQCDDGTMTTGGCECSDEFSNYCLNAVTPCAKSYTSEFESRYRDARAEWWAQYEGTADEAWFLANVPLYESLTEPGVDWHYCEAVETSLGPEEYALALTADAKQSKPSYFDELPGCNGAAVTEVSSCETCPHTYVLDETHWDDRVRRGFCTACTFEGDLITDDLTAVNIVMANDISRQSRRGV